MSIFFIRRYLITLTSAVFTKSTFNSVIKGVRSNFLFNRVSKIWMLRPMMLNLQSQSMNLKSVKNLLDEISLDYTICAVIVSTSIFVFDIVICF